MSQKNYSQLICTNTTECDTSQGLTCYLSRSSCNCPNNSSIVMCGCNVTSYWNGIACVSRLPTNISYSLDYQCQTGLTCIVNQTDIGILSDICRCPLGYYFVTEQNCVPSYQCYEYASLICRYNNTDATCLDEDFGRLPSCDCNENYYYYDSITATCLSLLSLTNQTCAPCNGSTTNNCNKYPTTNLCVAVYNPTDTPYMTFTLASSACNGVTAMKTGVIPQLLSAHNDSELDCIASAFRVEYDLPLCKNHDDYFYYYLGYDTTSRRFYDGTYGCDVSSMLCWYTTSCATYCSNDNGKLNLATSCSSSYTGPGPN